MKLTFTKESFEKINMVQKQNNEEVLVLFYDTDGCGCAVNGVPVFLIKNRAEINPNLVKVEVNNSLDIFIYKKHIIFFGEEMTIVLKENNLVLKNKNEIFTHDLRIIRL